MQGDRVLLQVGDEWHLVVSPKHAAVIAKMLHDAAHGMPYAVDTITDLHTLGAEQARQLAWVDEITAADPWAAFRG